MSRLWPSAVAQRVTVNEGIAATATCRPRKDKDMKTTHKPARSDRVEQAMRWTLALALIAAVIWAWGHGGAGAPFAG